MVLTRTMPRNSLKDVNFLYGKCLCSTFTNRNEGYGLLPRHVERAKELGCSLIVTADHGISAIEATSKANELGIDVIITDHHQILKKEIDSSLHEAITSLKPITLFYSSHNLKS